MPKTRTHAKPNPKQIDILELGPGKNGGVSRRIAEFRQRQELPKKRIVIADAGDIEAAKVPGLEIKSRTDMRKIFADIIRKGENVRILKCDFFFNNIDEHDTNFFFANIKRIMPIGGKIIVNGSYHNNIALERFMRINGFTLKSERVIDAIKVSPRLLELFRSDPDLGLKFGDGNGMDHEKVVSWAKQNNIMQNFSEHAQFHAISLAFSRYIHRDGELNRFNLNPKLELTYTVFERVK